MIVNENLRRNEHIISGSGPLPYTFGILDVNDLLVIQDGIVLKPDQYQVTGVGQDGGGTVILATAPADGTSVIIIGNQPYKQTSVYSVEAFPPQRIQNDFNKVVIMIQQIIEILNRTPRMAPESTFDVPPFPEPTSVDQFLRVSNLNPLQLAWGTLGTLAGEVGIPLAFVNGGTGGAYISAGEVLQAWGGAMWGGMAIIPSTDILTLPSPLTGNRVAVDAGNFSSISTTGVAPGTTLILEYVAGGNVLTDSSLMQLQGRVNYTSLVGDRSVFMFNGTGWIEAFRIPQLQGINATRFLRGDGTYQQIVAQAPSGVNKGLNLINNTTDPDNDIDINAGDAFSDEADPTQRVQMVNPGVFTKQLDNTWAPGSGNGGRVSGQALADGTWHVFMFRRAGGAIDFCFSNGLAFVTPDGGTNRVLIMSVLREAGAIVSFFQEGDWVEFGTKTIQYDVVNPGTLFLTINARVPQNIRCMARITGQLRTSGIAVVASFSCPDALPGQAPALDVAPLYQIGLVNANHLTSGRQIDVMTNTSRQIRGRVAPASDAGTRLRVVTEGFFHPRGRR